MTRYRQPKLMEASRAMPTWTVDPDGVHGEVFTRRWVVDLILDLAGYRTSADLGALVIVEPACGAGAFLVPIVERLVESCARHGRLVADMGPAIRAFDLLDRNVDTARGSVAARLVELDQPADCRREPQLAVGWPRGLPAGRGAPRDAPHELVNSSATLRVFLRHRSIDTWYNPKRLPSANNMTSSNDHEQARAA